MVDRHHPGKAPTAILQRLSEGQCLTIGKLAEELDLTHKQVSDAAAKLLRRDYLDRMAIGCYQLTEAGLGAAAAGEVITSGPRGPRQSTPEFRNTLRQRAWRAMRMRRRFTMAELVMDAAAEKDGNPVSNLSRYLGMLKRCGYVVELPNRAEGTALTSNGFKRWMISRDTGPRAPVVLSKVPGIHDFNIGEDVLCAPR